MQKSHLSLPFEARESEAGLVEVARRGEEGAEGADAEAVED